MQTDGHLDLSHKQFTVFNGSFKNAQYSVTNVIFFLITMSIQQNKIISIFSYYWIWYYKWTICLKFAHKYTTGY